MAGEDSVSGVAGGSGRVVNQENPPMRIYIIGDDGITLCREAPTAPAVTSPRRAWAAGV